MRETTRVTFFQLYRFQFMFLLGVETVQFPKPNQTDLLVQNELNRSNVVRLGFRTVCAKFGR